MSDWYKSLFPDVQNEDELVLLYSLHTLLEDWEIYTPAKTFRIRPIRSKVKFHLFWGDEDDDPVLTSESVFEAVKAVANHKTGVEQWDESAFDASDYLPDWKREATDLARINFIDQWIECNPNGTLREMIDYFEHEPTCLLSRMTIIDFMKDMIASGQMPRFPRVWVPPAEASSLIKLAVEYGIPVRDDRPKRDAP